MKAVLVLILLSVPSVSSILFLLYDLINFLLGDFVGVPTEPEFGMTTPQIIAFRGYPIEIHHVTTADGYILELHRIPHGTNGPGSAPRPPVLMMHGFQFSSIAWVLNTPDKVLAYQLADAGLDVWLGNFRGNEYTLNHTSLNADSKEFWDFCWDEMAKYDLPAMIDYVLDKTGQPKLWYIGHSMGTTVAFATLSSKPEYNDKVKNFTAFAPVVTLANMKSPIRLAALVADPAYILLTQLDIGKLNTSNSFTELVMTQACRILPISIVCTTSAFATNGFDYGQMNYSRVDYYVSNLDSPSSVRTLIHYAQIVNSDKFNYFDFKAEKNLIKYNQSTPPEYNITKITTPVSIFYGDNDWLADPKDVAKIPPKLQNLVLYHRVAYSLFNHIDFIVALDVNPLVNDHILQAYETYN